jgi:hypothetical protein
MEKRNRAKRKDLLAMFRVFADERRAAKRGGGRIVSSCRRFLLATVCAFVRWKHDPTVI